MTITVTSDKKLFLKYLFVSTIVSLANIFFLFDRNIATFIAFVEIIILLFLLFKRKIAHFLSFYVMFITNCVEMGAFVGTSDNFYNLKNIRIFDVNLGVWILIPVVCFCLKNINISKIKKMQPKFYFYTKNLLLLNIMAATVGLILIAVNDNNITSIGNIFYLYINATYIMLFLPFSLAAIMYYIYLNTPKEMHYISFSLEATLWGTAVQIIFAKQFGIMGYYGGLDILLTSGISFFAIPLIFILYWDSKNIVFPKMNIIIGLVANVLFFMYNAGGKTIILLGISICIFYTFLVEKVSLFFKYCTVFFLLCLFFIVPLINAVFIDINPLYLIKFNQVSSLFNVWDSNWYLNMAGSPRVRITEMINVGIEYWNKPWLIITGKGYLGSIKDYVNMFSSYQGSFSYAEWNAGVFYNLHEFSTQLLMFGLLGVCYSIRLFKETIKLYKSNIWIIFGCCWFLIMYGYSFTISTFGIVALFYGLKATSDEKSSGFLEK